MKHGNHGWEFELRLHQQLFILKAIKSASWRLYIIAKQDQILTGLTKVCLFYSILSHNLRRSSGHHRRIRNNPPPPRPVLSRPSWAELYVILCQIYYPKVLMPLINCNLQKTWNSQYVNLAFLKALSIIGFCRTRVQAFVSAVQRVLLYRLFIGDNKVLFFSKCLYAVEF